MKLWLDYLRLKDNPDIDSNLPSFFNALITWVKAHRRLISDGMLIESGLLHIMDIDPAKYGVELSQQSLNDAKNRLFYEKPIGVNSLLSKIYFELLDLLSTPDSKNRSCPICDQGGLVYVVIAGAENHEIFLQCDHYCLAHSYLFEIDTLSKVEWPKGFATIPANKEQIFKRLHIST